MTADRSLLRFAAASIGICLVVGGCGRAKEFPLLETSEPGSIDERPNPFWGKPYPYMPPEPDGEPFDPTGGLGIQRFADRLVGRQVAHFVAHGSSSLRSGVDIHDFYPAATPGPGPGMCEARRFQITGHFSGSRVVRTSEGRWLPPVYAVVGSLTPVAEERAEGYRRRLEQACRRRTDLDMWFSAEPQRAYLGARLADAVVAAARQQGRLTFELRCAPYPPDIHYRPQCATDVRKITASLNPRAILEVGECFEEPGPDCVSVQLAKLPERSTQIEERWTLDIRFDQINELTIREAELADTQLIID